MGMGDWLNKRLESIMDNLIFAGVVAVGLAIWNKIRSLSLPLIIAISLGAFIVILVAARLVVFFKHKEQM